MSLQSYLLLKFGFNDIDERFEKVNKLLFDIQNTFDTNKERRTLLKEIKEHTHVNYARLKGLWDIATEYCKNKGKGSFVETGVWRGGCAGILSHISKKYGYKNKLYFFDSFEGLPEPVAKDGADAKKFADGNMNGQLKSIKKLIADESYIKNLLFKKLEIDKSRVKIVKGWFQKTLPRYKLTIGPIGILRLDGDWYESTKVCLENLYDLVEPGGYIIIDDYYYWDGCKKATDEFIKLRNLDVEIIPQDTSGVYFIKSNSINRT